MQGYVDGTLEDGTCSALIDHVRSCEHCMEELETFYTIDYALRFMDDEKAFQDDYDFRRGLQEDLEKVRGLIAVRRNVDSLQRFFLILGEMVLICILLLDAFPPMAIYFNRLLQEFFAMV